MIKFCLRDRKKYGWLSNFAHTPFMAGGKRWKTVEHFFQAMKTQNPETRELIRMANSASAARGMGKRVILRKDWEEIKERVMLFALERKFRLPQLKKQLLETNNKELVEDAPWDSYWGAGRNGKGKNRLGVLLLKVRETLRKGE